MAVTNTKREEISMANAPHVMTSACFKIIGMAMLPTAEAPVKNLVASTQLHKNQYDSHYHYMVWGQFGHSDRPEIIMQKWAYFRKTAKGWSWKLQKYNQWSRIGYNCSKKGQFLKGFMGHFWLQKLFGMGSYRGYFWRHLIHVFLSQLQQKKKQLSSCSWWLVQYDEIWGQRLGEQHYFQEKANLLKSRKLIKTKSSHGQLKFKLFWRYLMFLMYKDYWDLSCKIYLSIGGCSTSGGSLVILIGRKLLCRSGGIFGKLSKAGVGNCQSITNGYNQDDYKQIRSSKSR
ncbi:hypothetical protein LXL04_020493 [Taraxacum kok-saghyz]